MFAHYTHSVIVSSFSKNLALAGERIGYVAVNPALAQAGELMAGLVFSNRVLGFVNAPCLGQKIIAACLEKADELAAPQYEVYLERRRLMAQVLDAAGIQYQLPAGTFYFFPKTPKGLDDVAFVQQLLQQRILAVPGSASAIRATSASRSAWTKNSSSPPSPASSKPPRPTENTLRKGGPP